MTRNESDHGIRPPHPGVHSLHGLEHIGCCEGGAPSRDFEFMGQDIEQDLGVTVGVDVPVVELEQISPEGI